MMQIRVNGTAHEVDVEPEMPLLWLLRDVLDLTGTKYGCGVAYCGACTVLLDGKSVRTCLILAIEVDGHEITTLEGLTADGLTDLQKALLEHNSFQCGFCAPGVVLSATELFNSNPKPTEHDAKEAISGNLCRCTGYKPIIEAILAAKREASTCESHLKRAPERKKKTDQPKPSK